MLGRQGIRVVLMEGLIEEGLEAVYQDAEIRAPLRASTAAARGCAGNGQGCSSAPCEAAATGRGMVRLESDERT